MFVCLSIFVSASLSASLPAVALPTFNPLLFPSLAVKPNVVCNSVLCLQRLNSTYFSSLLLNISTAPSCNSSSELLVESLDDGDWTGSTDDAEKKKKDNTGKFTASDNNTKSGREREKKNVNVLLKLLGPLANTRLRSIKRTVWFWGILLGGLDRQHNE